MSYTQIVASGLSLPFADGRYAALSHTHAASAIVSGALALARGGTNADLSATGGSTSFLRQASAGAVISVGGIVSADLTTALTTPPAIGGTTASTGAFTTLRVAGAQNLSLGGIKFSSDAQRFYLQNPSDSTNFGFEYLSSFSAVSLGFFSGSRIRWVDSGTQAVLVGGWTFSANGNYPSPNLGADNNSSNDVRLEVRKSGNGASQSITVTGMRFSAADASPSLDIYANGIRFGIRDGSVSAEAFDLIAAVIAPTTGYFGVGTTAPATRLHIVDATAGNLSSVVTGQIIGRNDSGTPAAGFGTAILFEAKSSTTVDRDIAIDEALWSVATDASRMGRRRSGVYDVSTVRYGVDMVAVSGGVQLGFYGVTPVSRQILATGVGATVDNVITALQNLGLVRQS